MNGPGCLLRQGMRRASMLSLLLSWAVVVPFLFVACSDDSAERAAKERRERFVADSLALKIAVTPTLDCLPLFVADEYGMFEDEGLSVRLRTYQAQMDQDTAMQQGRVEAMTTDLVRAEYLRRCGFPLRYVAVTPLQWQLVSNPIARIRQLSQLDDKMMAMTRHSATAMYSDMAIDSASLLPERVFRIQVNDVAVRLSMLLTGVMDAMWLPEPQATAARLVGSPVVDDSQMRNMSMGVIAFSEAALTDSTRRQQMESFVEVYNMACDTIAHYGLQHFSSLVSERCSVAPNVADSLTLTIPFLHAAPPRQSDIDKARAWLDKDLR